MKINDSHILEGAKWEPIVGGNDMPIRRCLVIHFTAGASAKSSIDSMRDQGLSAHLVIDRDGTIYQCRQFNKTCGHAGVSRWKDPKTGKLHTNCNAFSIGIELANAGDTEIAWVKKQLGYAEVQAIHRNGGKMRTWEKYSQAQLDACFAVSKALCEKYNLDDVTGHDCIAPERKSDPGPAFPMKELRTHCGFSGLPEVHHL